MKLNVPKEKAIKILERRLSEIDKFDFEPNSWKNKTKNDIMEIFNDLTKSFQVGFINFNTPLKDSKLKILEKGKKEARELIKSYIQSINDYHIEKKFEIDPNFIIKNELNRFKTNNVSLVKENDKLNSIITRQNITLEENKRKIQDLIDNTVQLSNISIKKLFKIIGSLPSKQILVFSGIITTILGSSFLLGKSFKENSFKNEEFELKRKYENAVIEKNNSIDSIKLLMDNHKSTLPKNKELKVVIYNSLDEGISINFENISKNKNKIKSIGTSIRPKSFGTIILKKFNYKWSVKKFINYKKNAITEKNIYKENIIRVNEDDELKLIKIN